MYYAKHKCGLTIEPIPNGRANCLSCESEVIAKCGSKNAWHWAHKADANCEKKNKGAWHSLMQEKYPVEMCEVYFKNERGESRRADVSDGVTVIEFQDSFITQEEVTARNSFYNELGLEVVWVVKCFSDKKTERITISHPPSNGWTHDLDITMFRWDSPAMSKLPVTNTLILAISEKELYRLDYYDSTLVFYDFKGRECQRNVIYGSGRLFNEADLISMLKLQGPDKRIEMGELNQALLDTGLPNDLEWEDATNRRPIREINMADTNL